jgi:hypothetical protein
MRAIIPRRAGGDIAILLIMYYCYNVAVFPTRFSVVNGGTNMYIDPGSGGMLFGMLVGALGTITGIFMIFTRQIKTFFKKVLRRSTEEEVVVEVETEE